MSTEQQETQEINPEAAPVALVSKAKPDALRIARQIAALVMAAPPALGLTFESGGSSCRFEVRDGSYSNPFGYSYLDTPGIGTAPAKMLSMLEDFLRSKGVDPLALVPVVPEPDVTARRREYADNLKETALRLMQMRPDLSTADALAYAISLNASIEIQAAAHVPA